MSKASTSKTCAKHPKYAKSMKVIGSKLVPSCFGNAAKKSKTHRPLYSEVSNIIGISKASSLTDTSWKEPLRTKFLHLTRLAHCDKNPLRAKFLPTCRLKHHGKTPCACNCCLQTMWETTWGSATRWIVVTLLSWKVTQVPPTNGIQVHDIMQYRIIW